MTLSELGYNESLHTYRQANQLESFAVGRVISEHKERYVVKTEGGEFQAELLGNLRFAAESRRDFPAVGDWVAIAEYDADKALIHAIFPRTSLIERQAVGRSGQVQIIAVNIDYGLIVQAADRDFNLNRLERYLTICHASGVKPVILLSKIDLIDGDTLAGLLAELSRRISEVPIIPISNESNAGFDRLKGVIRQGQTYCLLGSSGVGKSTLLNKLAGKEQMKTGEISSAMKKGKHTTSHRELIVLEGGGILIDNPGMREVGITDAASGLEMTFDTIVELTEACKFKNCTHRHEAGCAVLEALESGAVDEEAYQNFQKMLRERSRFETTLAERRKKDKSQGKLYKRIQEERRRRKY